MALDNFSRALAPCGGEIIFRGSITDLLSNIRGARSFLIRNFLRDVFEKAPRTRVPLGVIFTSSSGNHNRDTLPNRYYGINVYPLLPGLPELIANDAVLSSSIVKVYTSSACNSVGPQTPMKEIRRS